VWRVHVTIRSFLVRGVSATSRFVSKSIGPTAIDTLYHSLIISVRDVGLRTALIGDLSPRTQILSTFDCFCPRQISALAPPGSTLITDDAALAGHSAAAASTSRWAACVEICDSPSEPAETDVFAQTGRTETVAGVRLALSRLHTTAELH